MNAFVILMLHNSVATNKLLSDLTQIHSVFYYVIFYYNVLWKFCLYELCWISVTAHINQTISYVVSLTIL